MGELTFTILKLVLSLSLVLALAFAAIWLMRRFQIGMGHIGQGDEPITFLRSLPIGPRERLALIACRGNVYLLGVTAAGIALIDTWADGEGHQMPDPKMEMEPPKDADTP